MGEIGSPLALPALMTAQDLEREPLTRGFLLVSIGRQGGPAARDFLLEVLTEGDRFEQPWAALGLGLWSRDEADPAVLAALRRTAGSIRDRSSVGATWLALGLARDAGSTEALSAALAGGDDPRTRSYAAYSLAMIGTPDAHAKLIESLAGESSSMARAAIGLSLGIVGNPEDAGRLIDLVRTTRVPELQGQAATAVAFHGSIEGFHGLGRLSSTSNTTDLARSAAIDGLGMQLSATPVLSMAELSRSANFTLFGDWLADALQTTL
jgi:HEAT repeat protein